MSFSVDDLISSLSESHIGQEANDIATLQAQLAQSLFGGGPISRGGPSRGLQNTQPCNTPMARTRASSFVSWNGPTSQRLAEYHLDNDMEEDERMVEELLIPSSNSPYKSGTPHFPNNSMPSSPMSSSFQNNYTSNSMTSPQQHSDPVPSSPASIFTSTDPFYIAQLQASQSYNNPSPQSVFSQNGHISQSSPFATQLQTTQYHHHQHHQHHHHPSQYQNWDNQPKSMAMTCAAAF